MRFSPAALPSRSISLPIGGPPRELLVDRGPSSGSTTGVFYLTREGYPYRIFAESHREIVRIASGLSRQEAAAQLLTAYLAAALFVKRSKLLSMFKHLLTPEDSQIAIQTLI